jgi:hypothetical protein
MESLSLLFRIRPFNLRNQPTSLFPPTTLESSIIDAVDKCECFEATVYLQHALKRVPLEEQKVSYACLLVIGPALLVALAKKLSQLDAEKTF